MATRVRSFISRGGWLSGVGMLSALLIALLPRVALGQSPSDDAEVPPGVADAQLRFDAHAADLPPPQAPRPVRQPRPPITIEMRRVRIAVGYTFMIIGGLTLVMGTTMSRGNAYSWVTQIAAGSAGAFLMVVVGLPVLISGYARPYQRPQFAFRIGPGHLEFTGHF